MNDNELTLKARAIARTLSYNEDEPQAAAKHMLLELAHRLDARTIRVHKKQDGLLLINGAGLSRFATFTESLLYRLFGVVPARI